MNTDQLLFAGSRIVGVVFLAAAVMKAINPSNFHGHITRLGLVPRRWARLFAPALIGVEGAWGAALIIAFAPTVVLPATAVALVLLSGMSAWGVRSGRTEDCGCYGGFITPSLWQSVGLNGLYFALTSIAWTAHPVSNLPPIT